MTPAEFHSRRRFAHTACGRIAYVEQGRGAVTLFVHGVPLNGYHWRHIMSELSCIRRCIALDLMGLGYSEVAPTQDVSFAAQATMVLQFLDALDIAQIDLVANDSGGAVAQIFAAHHPQRLRTLTLTNCDVHDNWPPALSKPMHDAAQAGTLLDSYVALVDDAAARHTRLARAFADPTVLTDEVYRVYIDPLLSSPERRADFHRYWTSFDNRQTTSIEALLRRLCVPTLVVWGLDDGFFGIEWARWLVAAIPGIEELVEVPDAKLFFAEDRPQALVKPLRAFLNRHPPRATGVVA